LYAGGAGYIGGNAGGNEAVAAGIDGGAAALQAQSIIGSAVYIVCAIGVCGVDEERVGV
jgi:hypothetical protein